MNKIGFSVIISPKRPTNFYLQLLEKMQTAGCEAIEIHTPEHNKINRDLIMAIKQFSYRSIHTTDLTPQSLNEANYYQSLTSEIDTHALTIHPHTMQKWSWLHEYFGSKASFENMDWRKPFGTSPDDMSEVFEQYSNARWTYDLNHVYTNDDTMILADEFYSRFDNLGHYHLSGFKDERLPHTTLHTTHQNIIIEAVKSNHPIIIESYGIDDIENFETELEYITPRLAQP
jgi:hypothetical protein